MPRPYHSIVDTIGRTPVVRINRLAPAGVDLFVKVEAFNPLGSIKDRLALGVIEDAERRGELRPGQTVVEATSGNTGIGLAMVCAAKGYPFVAVMAENFSIERRKILRFLGAKVVLTPAPLRGMGMIAKARELAETHGWFLCRQFENEANADVHSRTTAQEIVADFEGRRLDYWVTGFGTGGTLKGVARVLADRRPDTRVIVCEPDNSAILAGGVDQPRNEDGSPSDSHPEFRTHPVQGWSPDFVPKLAGDVRDAELIDGYVPVSGEDALRMSRELARREGIFTGISGGATFAGALQIAEAAPEGTAILCMLPDTGERYLSTVLFDDIAEEMTEEEQELSRSTPGSRFDSPASSTPEGSAPVTVDAEAAAFVESALDDPGNPVVLFALEWCEFCWTLRKLLESCGIAYRAIDLDSAAFDRDGWGDRVRAALRARVGVRTVPQLFVGGDHVGGCTETLDAHADGTLGRLLAEHGVAYRAEGAVDARELMPAWLHPR